MGGEWTLQQNQGSVAEKYMATGAGLITSGVQHNALLAFRAWGLRSRERWRLAREQPADAGARVCDQNPVICIFAGTNLLLFSRSVVSDSLRPRGPQHARPPRPSPTPGVHPNSCRLSRWCHPTISFSVVCFSSCPQSFPASGSFPMSQLFASGGHSIGVSASTSFSLLFSFFRVDHKLTWAFWLIDWLLLSPAFTKGGLCYLIHWNSPWDRVSAQYTVSVEGISSSLKIKFTYTTGSVTSDTNCCKNWM